jgi:membrane-associated phospholipid phosphatase
MNYLGNRNSRLILEERLTISMVTGLNLFIVCFGIIRIAWDIFIMNSIIIISIFLVMKAHQCLPKPWMQFFRDWYVPAFLIFIYLENRRLIPFINPHDFDSLFIRIDRFIFLGHDPTVLIEKLTNPVLSEFLQLSYASFYFIPFTLALFAYLKRSRLDFHIIVSTILMGFYLSYLGYYITPVIGPRYTLDHFQSFPLTGVYTFGFVRNLLTQVEGMMMDCCPSGHTLISLLTVLLARRYFRPFFLISSIWAFIVIFSTVYLRYHYVVDLIAGAILGLLVYKVGPFLSEHLIHEKDEISSDADMYADLCQEEPYHS